MYDAVRRALRPPDLLVYLRASLPTLRAPHRARGRTFEQRIEDGYLERLGELYEGWVEAYDLSPIVVVDADRFDVVARARRPGRGVRPARAPRPGGAGGAVSEGRPPRPYRREVPLHRGLLLLRALGAEPAGVPDATVTGVAQHADKVEPGARVRRARRCGRRRPRVRAEAVARGAVCVVGTRAGDAGPRRALRPRRRRPLRHLGPGGGLPRPPGGVARRGRRHRHGRQDDHRHPAAPPAAGRRRGGSTRRCCRPRSCASAATAGALEGHFTTPEATEVQAHLAAARDAASASRCSRRAPTPSSLQRLAHVRYDLLVWTNLTPGAPRPPRQLRGLPRGQGGLVARAGAAILNRDDPSFARSPRPPAASRPTASIPRPTCARRRRAGAGGCASTLVARGSAARHPADGGRLQRARTRSPRWRGPPPRGRVGDRRWRLARFAGVPGRMQVVATAPFTVVVDFAHTPDALAKALAALTPGRADAGSSSSAPPASATRPSGRRSAPSRPGPPTSRSSPRRTTAARSWPTSWRGWRRRAGAGGVEGEAFHRARPPRGHRAGAAPGGTFGRRRVGRQGARTHAGARPRGAPWDEAAEARAAAAARRPGSAPRASDA
jgi:hypothetical protein